MSFKLFSANAEAYECVRICAFWVLSTGIIASLPTLLDWEEQLPVVQAGRDGFIGKLFQFG
jgi:hypothetical protein